MEWKGRGEEMQTGMRMAIIHLTVHAHTHTHAYRSDGECRPYNPFVIA